MDEEIDLVLFFLIIAHSKKKLITSARVHHQKFLLLFLN